MSDETVEIVAQALKDIAFANGVDEQSVRPLADVVVIRLRNAGMDDLFIENAFSEATP